uniref:Aminotransferase class I/classII domain-containing protein n=1 Tax=Acrobeloides nanus TaxID=290746 RepID=A0A914CGV1_9BILA
MEEGVIDLKRLEEQIDKNTIAMIVNNPMNPAGIVFSKSHLEEVLKIAYKHKIIIIADEIYGDLTFNNSNFYPLATLSPKVPIICCDGISKRYLVPGWRLGWLILYNRYNALDNIKSTILTLTQHMMGPCALIQGALPAILEKTPLSFHENICNILQNNADIVYKKISDIPGLKPLKPYGAMYMMVKIDPKIYGNEWKFIENLIKKESVYCFHGSLFNAPNWFRMLLTFPEEVTKEACDRIAMFCFKQQQQK